MGLYGKSAQTTERGDCPRCGKNLRLTNARLIPAHKSALVHKRYCTGCGLPPKPKEVS